MRSDDWIKLDPKNLPPFGRMLVTNCVGFWAVDMVHAGHNKGVRGEVFAYTDNHQEVCNLTHYAPIAKPWDCAKKAEAAAQENPPGWKPGIECEHGYDACPICDK